MTKSHKIALAKRTWALLMRGSKRASTGVGCIRMESNGTVYIQIGLEPFGLRVRTKRTSLLGIPELLANGSEQSAELFEIGEVVQA